MKLRIPFILILLAFSVTPLGLSLLSVRLPAFAASQGGTPTPSPTPTPTATPTSQDTSTPPPQTQPVSTSTPTTSTKSSVTAKPTVTPRATSTTTTSSPASGPQISGLVIDQITSTGARIIWQTSEAAKSILECRENGDFTEKGKSDDLVTAHELKLTALTPETEYICRAKSSNAAGGITTSEDQAFTTLSETNQVVTVQDAQSTRWWPWLSGLLALLLLLFGWIWQQRKKRKNSNRNKTSSP